MSVPGCPECKRLRKDYAAATDARFRAESDLTAAVFSHDSGRIEEARETARSKLACWAQAAEALRHHVRNHARAANV